MLLAELVRGLNITNVKGDGDIEIKGIAYDSRKVGKGYVFVCIDGMATDGHDYACEAVENGAAALIVQKDMGMKENVTVMRTGDTRKALAYVSDRFYGHPSGRFRLIGITGTKGKTTTSFMVKTILEAAGRKVGLIGTLGTRIGERELYSEHTTPESLELQMLFSEMAEEGVDAVVMEVSSQGLALQRVGACEFDTAVFTNLSRDHIGKREHASMEEYLLAKCKLFKMSKRGLVNLDSAYASKVLDEAECVTMTFGLDERSDIRAYDIVKMPQKVEFNLTSPWYEGKFSVNIPGRFSVYNALASAGVSGLLGVSQEIVQKGLERVQVPGRAELVDTGRNFSVIIDYAHSPDSLENILSTVKDYAAGRVICVFGCGGDRDRAKRPMMGAISVRLADYTVITSDNPRTEDPDSIIAQIEEGIKSKNDKYKCIRDRREAIRHAMQTAEAGDVLVLAGKGHETYQIFNDKTIHFDEREVVREIIEEMKMNLDATDRQDEI
jgi:UDP-N-acetylmuramoyl-L-alanyl-D-glutamate--2,6-diaminopimelate ligase